MRAQLRYLSRLLSILFANKHWGVFPNTQVQGGILASTMQKMLEIVLKFYLVTVYP